MRRYSTSKTVLALFLMAAFIAVMAGCSQQAKYPTKAIEYVVPLPPGGGSDLGARTVAKALSKELGVPVNVVNKPGGNQIPGTKAVMDSKNDGYTLIADGASQGSLHVLQKNLPYKLEDRTFVARVMSAPHAFFVNANSPWNSLSDVAAAVKANPGEFSWGWSGGNTTTDFVLLQFFKAAGVDINQTKRVPTAGAGKTVTSVAGNHIKFGAGGASAVFSLAKSGDIKVLAVTGNKRLGQLPNVPTTVEAGFPEVDLNWWIGISGPKDMPQEVVDKLAAAAKKVAEDPAVSQELANIGAYPDYLGAKETREYVLKEAEMFKELATKVEVK